LKRKNKKVSKNQGRPYTPWHVYLGDSLKHLVNEEDMEISRFVKVGS